MIMDVADLGGDRRRQRGDECGCGGDGGETEEEREKGRMWTWRRWREQKKVEKG